MNMTAKSNKTTIQLAFDAEKLNAVKQYMSRKDADLYAELDEFVYKLYEKYVPAAVREYIESLSDSGSDEPKPLKQPRPRLAKDKAKATATATANDNEPISR
jgi:rRNA-processing protein FCF1